MKKELRIGKNMKFIRAILALRQSDLAKKLGVCPLTVCNFETGRREIQLKYLLILQDLCLDRFTIDEILTEDLHQKYFSQFVT